MSTELATRVEETPPNAKELYRVATDVAGVCGDIVKRTAKMIQNRKYVCVEGWMAIATAHGCCLSIDSVSEDPEGNVTSIASVRRMSDSRALAHAEGFVGMDEKTWKSRPRYACRAMAQTRAMSRAARAVFAHVVVLIDGGLSTTPAEEVPDEGFDHQFSGNESPAPKLPPPPAPKATPANVAEMKSLLGHLPDDTIVKWFTKAGVETWEDMPDEFIVKCIAYTKKLAAEPVAATK